MPSKPKTMRCKRLFTGLAAAALAAQPALAGDDFGIWTGVTFQKSFNKKFSMDAGLDYRAEQNLRHVARWDVSVGADYKLTKFLKVGAGYVYILDRNPREAEAHYSSKGVMNGYNIDDSYWRRKHRAYAEVTGKVSAGRFTFSLRERYQFTHFMPDSTWREKYRGAVQPGYEGAQYGGYMFSSEGMDDKPAKDRHFLRSRLQVEYNIRHCPLTPFVSYELSNNLGDGFHLDKQRFSIGADWKIKKKHVLTIAYIHEDGADDDSNGNLHAIDIGYKFKF